MRIHRNLISVLIFPFPPSHILAFSTTTPLIIPVLPAQRPSTLSSHHLFLPRSVFLPKYSFSLPSLSVQSPPVYLPPTPQYLCPFCRISLPQYLPPSPSTHSPSSSLPQSVCLSLAEQITPACSCGQASSKLSLFPHSYITHTHSSHIETHLSRCNQINININTYFFFFLHMHTHTWLF